jgi:2,4-dienoyl-CoA reductase-like NADH-dependent reductase (Old Yellow Enzyme family)
MAEGMADSTHMPDENAIRAYSNWAEGGWGLIITGIDYLFGQSAFYHSLICSQETSK